MEHKISLLMPALFFMLSACAQSNGLQVGIGYQRTWMVDKQASPLKYQTSETTLLLHYNHQSNKALFDVQLDGAFGDFFPTGFQNRQLYDAGYDNDGTPKKDSFPMIGKIYNGKCKIAYARNTGNGFSTFGKENLYSKNYVGASLNNQLFYTDNFVRTGWLNSSSLNAEYYHTALLGSKHSFSLNLSIPLFARNTRLPYHNSISSPDDESNFKIFFKQGSRWVSLFNFQNIQLQAGYEYALSKHVAVGLRYSGQWLHYEYEKPVSLFQNNIGLTGTFK